LLQPITQVTKILKKSDARGKRREKLGFASEEKLEGGMDKTGDGGEEKL